MDAGTALFMFCVVALGLLLAWDKIGRDLYWDLREALEARGWLPSPPPDSADLSTVSPDRYVEPGVVCSDVTDGQTDGRRSVAVIEAIASRQLDRTRSALIDECLTQGWQVDELRGLLRGSNDALSAEIAAARQRLGLAERRTPIAGRPVPAGVEYED